MIALFKRMVRRELESAKATPGAIKHLVHELRLYYAESHLERAKHDLHTHRHLMFDRRDPRVLEDDMKLETRVIRCQRKVEKLRGQQ